MTPKRWGQLEELYQAARALPSSERSALLERANPELRVEVASLLAQEDIPGNGAFLDRPAWEGRESLLKHGVGPGGMATAEISPIGGPRPSPLGPGVRLGPYQL